MSTDDGADCHGSQKPHEVGGHVGDAHQGSREVRCDVDVVGVEAAVVEAVEADSDAQQCQDGLVVAANEAKADKTRSGNVKG